MSKERLVNLLFEIPCKADYCASTDCGRCADLDKLDRCQIEAIADAVLADGWIRLPCKVGDVVYALWSIPTEAKYIIYCAEIKKISQYKKNCRVTTFFELEPIQFRGRRKEYQIDDFGKTVFLTREEAEAKLKRR